MTLALRRRLRFSGCVLLAVLFAVSAQAAAPPAAWVAVGPARHVRVHSLPSGQLPPGARVDRAANRILLPAGRSRLTVLAGPAANMMSFSIAGLTNPDIALPAGATVVLTVVNVDDDMHHSLALSHGAPPFAVQPAATGVATPPLAPHAAAYDAAVLTVRGARAGAGYYVCTVAGHARAGMFGRFIIVAQPARSNP